MNQKMKKQMDILKDLNGENKQLKLGIFFNFIIFIILEQ